MNNPKTLQKKLLEKASNSTPRTFKNHSNNNEHIWYKVKKHDPAYLSVQQSRVWSE